MVLWSGATNLHSYCCCCCCCFCLVKLLYLTITTEYHTVSYLWMIISYITCILIDLHIRVPSELWRRRMAFYFFFFTLWQSLDSLICRSINLIFLNHITSRFTKICLSFSNLYEKKSLLVKCVQIHLLLLISLEMTWITLLEVEVIYLYLFFNGGLSAWETIKPSDLSHYVKK